MCRKIFQTFFIMNCILAGVWQLFASASYDPDHDHYIRTTIVQRPLRILSIDGGGIRGIPP